MISTSNLGKKVGIYAFNYKNKKEYKINEDTKFVAASAIKIFLLDLFLDYMIENKIDLSDIYSGNYTLVEDSPFFEKNNRKIQYLDILKSMITVSDNTATNIVIDILGFDNIEKYLIVNKFLNTKIQRKMCDFELRKKGIDNYTSPKDMFYFFDKLYNFSNLDIFNIISKFECKKLDKNNKNFVILKILSEQKDREKIPSGVDSNSLVLNKPGELPNVRNDSGIILSNKQNVFISIFSEEVINENDSDKVFVKITKDLLTYLS